MVVTFVIYNDDSDTVLLFEQKTDLIMLVTQKTDTTFIVKTDLFSYELNVTRGDDSSSNGYAQYRHFENTDDAKKAYFDYLENLAKQATITFNQFAVDYSITMITDESKADDEDYDVEEYYDEASEHATSKAVQEQIVQDAIRQELAELLDNEKQLIEDEV